MTSDLQSSILILFPWNKSEHKLNRNRFHKAEWCLPLRLTLICSLWSLLETHKGIKLWFDIRSKARANLRRKQRSRLKMRQTSIVQTVSRNTLTLRQTQSGQRSDWKFLMLIGINYKQTPNSGFEDGTEWPIYHRWWERLLT